MGTETFAVFLKVVQTLVDEMSPEGLREAGRKLELLAAHERNGGEPRIADIYMSVSGLCTMLGKESPR